MKERGITLLALIITIIIMLILASVTFGAINGGLFEFAGKAKTEVEETSIKSAIQQAYLMAKGESRTNKVSQQDMKKQVNNVLVDEEADVVEEGDKLIVIVDNKYYEVDNKGKVAGPSTLEPILNAGDITKGGTCTGTQASPYKIECIEDLVELSRKAYNNETKDKNKYYLLTKDLDFNSIFSYSNYRAKYSYNEEQNAYIPDENSETTIKELCTTGQGFIPIGLKYGQNNKDFTGIFDGQNNEIKNIYIKTANNAALFGGGYGATIKNITISGEITSTGSGAAGILAAAWGSKMENCHNKANVKSETGNAAGIIDSGGGNTITVVNCVNEGEIISINGQAFGISSCFVNLNKCRNFGDVTAKGLAGGICRKRLWWR